MHTREKGNEIESIVEDWLITKGYKSLQRNYVRRVGEIDLILLDPDECVVFVEVRYRQSQHYGGALASITWQKKNKLIRTANSWLQRYASADTKARIDVVAVRPSNPLMNKELTQPKEERFEDYYLQWVQNAIEE